MIIEIFVVLLILTFILIAFGSYLDNSALTIIGLSFLFLLGVVILSEGIDYVSGNLINETGATTTTVVKQYSSYTSNNFGIFTCVVAIIWFIILMVNIRQGRYD